MEHRLGGCQLFSKPKLALELKGEQTERWAKHKEAVTVRVLWLLAPLSP